ncbi:MAG: hypothetical protein KDI27_09925 [Gammaproteobacteria bacterium]|nr:hypothetical protein [Gammaproteobacteria bacterium]
MYTADRSALYQTLVDQVARVIDLDGPEVELLKINHSKYGVTNYSKCHVHDVLLLRIDGTLFYAKGEDVYLRVSSRYSLSYNSFLDFSLSLFQLDDCFLPERKFVFFDEPEIAEVSFERAVVQQHYAEMESINDETPPATIQNPKIRELFIFYLSRKERLMAKDGAIYDDVFNHHGRDVIHEVLASVLGQLLGVPVPTNHFGYKTSQFKPAFGCSELLVDQEHHRYVLSQAIHEKHPSPFMVDLLNKQFRESNVLWGLSLYREESNPLNLQFFRNPRGADSQSLGALIMAACPNHTDLIRSDFLDQLLGGAKDRKSFDYLMPLGLEGPIYTLDFGEILFPELMFVVNEPHYLRQKKVREKALKNYLKCIVGLAPDCPYRRTVRDLVARIKQMDADIIARLVKAIPERFLLDHFASGRYCYQTATMVDFLQNQFTTVAQQNDL